jgi:hypothetical protein
VTGAARTSTKRDKRERSRLQREAARRRLARQRTIRRTALLSAALVVVVVLLAWFFVFGRHHSPRTPPKYASGTPVNFDSLPGLLTGPQPWDANTRNLSTRLQDVGVPIQTKEGAVGHIHQHLDIYVNGRHVVVPADIGINTVGGFISPLHTHDTSGVIHVEPESRQTFTLGQFFGVWGVRFTPTCIGGYCNGGGRTLRVFVNGFPATKDPRQIELLAHDEIVVTYGTSQQLPHPVPSSYTFPFGL